MINCGCVMCELELAGFDKCDEKAQLREAVQTLCDLVVRYRSEHDKAADDRSGGYIDHCLCSVCLDAAEVLEKGNHV